MKTGGRQKGVRNKNRSFIFDQFANENPNLNVLCKFVEIAEVTDNEVLKFNCYKELAKYLLPQLRAIELKENITTENQFVITRKIITENNQ